MKTMVSTAGGQQSPVEPDDVLAPGARAGPWVIERELGRGGMGAVYAVVHEEIGKRAALKIVHARLLTPGFNADRMLLEARVVNQVGHPNIVDIFETGRLPDGRPYIVMERLEGQPLSYRADDGKILPDQVISILLQVCDALIAAHAAGIVHRDLKLDNVFLVDNPDDLSTPRVKLLDWGIAKVLSHDVRHTVEGQLVGTPQYLAPEQARGGAVSPQTDVYSLGVMAYELFLEQLPFEAETSAEIMAMHLRATPPPPRELWPEIPAALEQLVLAMLAKPPDDRPTMLEVARRLEAVRDELRVRQREVFLASPTCATFAPSHVGQPRPPVLPAVALRPRDSAEGHAPTVPAEYPSPSRRWQWAVGAAALVVGAMLFVLSRSPNTSAATAAATRPTEPALAATEPALAATEPALATTEPALAATEPPPVATAPIPREPPAPASAPERADEPRAPVRPRALHERPVVEPAPTIVRAIHRPASCAPAVRHAAVRKAPVKPRRTTKLDPDGTIDPFR